MNPNSSGDKPKTAQLTVLLQQMSTTSGAQQQLSSPVSDGWQIAVMQPEPVSGLSGKTHLFIFFAAAISALDFIFGADKAIKRYPFGDIKFFQINAVSSSVWTNFFFNWMAYIDLFEYDEEVGILHQAFALFAGAATIAPYFFIGFVGALWQKIVVAISTLFNLPVFYLGAIDFYDYFHADFVQQARWAIRCSPEKSSVAAIKSAVVFNMKENYRYFSMATKDQRTQFMSDYYKKDHDKKLDFLIDRCGEFQVERSSQRWFFCSGSGPVIGTATLAQNLGHAVLTVYAILTIVQIPVAIRWPLAILLGIGNFVPSIGYSFATMANFDLIDFLRTCTFQDVPQIQRVIEKDSWSAWLTMRVLLTCFRYLYITSGFGNDEVNEEGAVVLGAKNAAAQVAGADGNVSGAIVFNGVLNEKLFRRVMGWMVECLQETNVESQDKSFMKQGLEMIFSKTDAEDVRQLQFEQMFKKLLDEVMKLPLQEGIKPLQETDDQYLQSFAQRFFKDAAAGENDLNQSLLSGVTKPRGCLSTLCMKV